MALGIDPKIDYAFKCLFGREKNAALLIGFVNATVFSESSAHHHAFDLRDATGRLLFSDDFQAHILEIPKLQKAPEALQATWRFGSISSSMRRVSTLSPCPILWISRSSNAR
jgi:hypothetical protein